MGLAPRFGGRVFDALQVFHVGDADDTSNHFHPRKPERVLGWGFGGWGLIDAQGWDRRETGVDWISFGNVERNKKRVFEASKVADAVVLLLYSACFIPGIR